MGLLTQLVDCLSFGKFEGKFDIKIVGYGYDMLVSQVANTTLKEPRVGKNIPTVAEVTQGEVIKFAAAAAEAMRADGKCAHGGPRADAELRAHAAPLRAHSLRTDYHRQEAGCAAHDGEGQRRARRSG